MKPLTAELNLACADAAYKIAKLLAEGICSKWLESFEVKVRKLFLAPRGSSEIMAIGA